MTIITSGGQNSHNGAGADRGSVRPETLARSANIAALLARPLSRITSAGHALSRTSRQLDMGSHARCGTLTRPLMHVTSHMSHQLDVPSHVSTCVTSARHAFSRTSRQLDVPSHVLHINARSGSEFAGVTVSIQTPFTLSTGRTYACVCLLGGAKR